MLRKSEMSLKVLRWVMTLRCFIVATTRGTGITAVGMGDKSITIESMERAGIMDIAAMGKEKIPEVITGKETSMASKDSIMEVILRMT